MKRLILIILAFALLWPLSSQAMVSKNTYPRLANYFLKWRITNSEVKELARWNVLILDMEVQDNSRAQLLQIRALNPHIIILAYLTSEEILNNINDYNNAYLRQDLASGISAGWWLKDLSGHKVSNWTGTSMLNLSNGAKLNSFGQRFNDYLPEFVVNKLKASGLWDGVFYDNTWGDISWVNKNLDLNNDGKAESAALEDSLWSQGVKKMLAKTRALAGPNFIIVGNGRVYGAYQPILNGMMLEDFPSPWENGGTWSGSMQTYLKLPSLNAHPLVSIVDVYDKNQQDYRHMRYGLTSALLGNGFYSYNYDVSSPGQTWWYDEYNVNLGVAQSAPYNLLAPKEDKLPAGLWRRNFKNGIVIVNSTAKKQTYVFHREEFEKLKGQQDPSINNGRKVNYIVLAPHDGIILRNINNSIIASTFVNGYFYRVYNSAGQQQHNGFFAYKAAYPGEAKIFISTVSKTGEVNDLSASHGRLGIYQNGKKINNLLPYGNLYHNSLSLAATLDKGKLQQIITGAGIGGGPQVSVFDGKGQLKYRFFAYNKNLRGGVNVALGDLNGDGKTEIVTAPGPGMKPLIKIFSLSGHLEYSFLAYSPKFYGGVNVAVGDLNGDGKAEIITGPASIGGPQVRIFNARGRVLGSFFAYNRNFRGGIKIAISDINSDGRPEILVGLKNFY